jgi:hypothetical protein
MRTSTISALAIGLFLTGAGPLKAQTVEIQQQVNTCIELVGLREGNLVRLINGQSLRVLAAPGIEKLSQAVSKTRAWLCRLLERLALECPANNSIGYYPPARALVVKGSTRKK